MQRCSNEAGMFGKGIFSLMCFYRAAVEFITFTFVGVAPSAHFIIWNTQAASAPQIFHFHEDSSSLLCKIHSGS